MDRASKLVVFGWCCVAAAAIVYFSRAPWPSMPVWASAAFVGMAALTALDRRAVGLLLIFTYVFPIIIRTFTGLNYSPFSVVWTAGLLGAIAPDAVRHGWHVPVRLRPALVCWALAVVAGTLVVVLREFDFTWVTVWSTSLANSSAGGWPSFVVTWSLHTSLVLLSGMLWFDWLCREPGEQSRTEALIPLAASCAVMVAVAVYQLFIDVTVLNPTVYGAMGRASGTVMDANLAGMIGALWIGIACVLARPLPARLRLPVLGAGVVACWLAVWASGSRTGFATAAIVSAAVASAHVRRIRLFWTAAALAAVLAFVVIVNVTPSLNPVGPLARFRVMVGGLDAQSLRAFGGELWNRNGYGPIATSMIREHPLVGVGVGHFYIMQPDFARLNGVPPLVPDNAQNWYKHQLAELGVLGSVGWVAWMILLAALLFRPAGSDVMLIRAGRGMLIAFGAVSLVGMPGQEVPVSVTFWTIAALCMSLERQPPTASVARSRTVVMLVPVVLFAAGTLWNATTSLRVPARAQRGGWPYSYGFHPHQPSDGQGVWTDRHAVAVVPASTPHLVITATPNALAALPAHRRGGRSPMRIELRVNEQTVIDEEVTSPAAIEKYVHLPEPTQSAFLELHVNETYRPADVGLNDQRQLGVLLRWHFADAGPPEPQPPSGSAP